MKTIPTNCSCSQSLLWTFCAAQTIGPVEIYLTRCNIVGTSFHETRKLISRDYPTGVHAGDAGTVLPDMIRMVEISHRIVCRFTTAVLGKTVVMLCDPQGRVIQRSIFQNLAAGPHEVHFPLSSIHSGIAVLFLQTGAAATCGRLIEIR